LEFLWIITARDCYRYLEVEDRQSQKVAIIEKQLGIYELSKFTPAE
jgi:hypothetical protein